MTKSRHINRPRKPWTEAELLTLRRLYPDMVTYRVAQALSRPVSTVYTKALSLGIEKSAEFRAGPSSGRLRKGHADRGNATRFTPGQTSWNKGKKVGTRGRAGDTQFKKGNRPHTWRPVGTERINADGYLDRKMTDTGYPPRDWVGVHRSVWMAAHGPIPPGHVVVFKPGRHSTVAAEITLDAVELLTRVELMGRNTVHNLPKELAELVQLRGALTRQINRRRTREEQNQ